MTTPPPDHPTAGSTPPGADGAIRPAGDGSSGAKGGSGGAHAAGPAAGRGGDDAGGGGGGAGAGAHAAGRGGDDADGGAHAAGRGGDGAAGGRDDADPAAAESVPGVGPAGVAALAAAEAERAATRRRERAVGGTLAAGLILEGITVLFVPMAIARIGAGGISGTKLTLVLLLAAALFTAAGLQRRRVGLIAGSVLQLAVIATGVLVPAMYFLGLLFAGVWVYLLWVRQEVTRAAARAARS